MNFVEKQHFPNWLRYGIFVATCMLLLFMISSGELGHLNSIPPIAFIALLCLPNILLIWIQVTEIDSANIYIKVRPFINKKIPFSQIESWSVRTYRPLVEYGGWGLRFGMNGTAYNIKGNKGLQLYLTGGRKILIGTQKEVELQKIMRKLCPLKEKANQ